jgi:hypothetical protein
MNHDMREQEKNQVLKVRSKIEIVYYLTIAIYLNLLFNQLIQLQPKIRGIKICKNNLVCSYNFNLK